MRPKTLIAYASAALMPGVLIFIAILSAHAAPQQAVPRYIRVPRGSLIDAIRDSDTDVTVTGKYNRPLTVHAPSGVSPVIWALNNSSALVVKLDGGRPSLTQEGNWIHTAWDGEIADVLWRQPGQAFKVGGKLAFWSEGGELRIKNATVRAQLEWAGELHPGAEYLMFVRARFKTL